MNCALSIVHRASCIVHCIAVLLAFTLTAKAYDLKNITAADGLSNSSVLSIMARGDGRILFGTCDGLNAYDGNRVWKFQSLGEQYISGSIILHCDEGRDQVIWVLTNHGLNKMKDLGREVILYPQFQGLRRFRMNPSKDIFLISGDQFFCSNGMGDSLQAIHVRDFPGGSIKDFEVTDRYFYLFTDQCIWRYDIRQGKDGYQIGARVLVDKMPIVYASRDDDEEFLVTPDGLLRSYNLVNGEKSSIISIKDEMDKRGRLNHVRRFKDALYASFETSGIVRLSLNNGQYAIDEFAIKVGVTSLFKDPGGDILWIGTDGKGAYMLYDAPYSFLSYTYDDMWMSLSKPTRSVFLDHEQTLWMGTKGDGIISVPRFNIHAPLSQAHKQVHRHDNSGMSSDLVYQFQSSSRPLLWILGAEGVDCYSYLTRSFSHVASDKPLSHVIAAWEQVDTLWMASLSGGVFKAEIAGTAAQPRLVNIRQYILDGGHVSSNYFFGLSHDDKGRVWLANRGKGVYLIENGRLRSVPFRKAYSNKAIYDVFAVLPVGRDLWIGTGAGIVIQRHDGREQLLDTEAYLPNNTIHALIADTFGNVYATTNNGIVCFLKGDIGNSIVWNDHRVVTEYSDGGATLTDDILLFAGNNGLSCIKRNGEVSPPKRQLKIYFTDIHIQERHENIFKYLSDEGGSPTLRLGYLQNSFSISVASLNYAEEADIVYSYRFSTKEKWASGRNSGVISVSKLPWGRHKLYIKAHNRLNGAESKVTLLDIYIVPPFYWSIWAKLFYLSLALALIYLLFHLWWVREKARRKMEIKHLEQQQRDQMYEEKLNFLTNVVHELNTPLTLIYGPCERVLSYYAADGFIRKNIKQVVMNLSRLNYLIQEIIDFRRVTTGHHAITVRRVDVSSFLTDICQAYKGMASDNNITLEQNVSEDIVWNSDERAFLRIVYNLVSNAFKYTKNGGKISVSLKVLDNKLCFSVYNTGKGIAPEEQDKIFNYYTVFEHVDESDNRGLTSRNGLGMAICHKMVKKLKGDIQINSKVDEYAEFVVTLPSLPLAEGASQEIVRASSTFSADTPFASEASISPGLYIPSHQGEGHEDSSTPSAPQRGDGSTILAIDDNADILKLLQESLEGYRVVTASNAEDGFAKLKEEMPDLIITDIMMPGIDGLDFTLSVKQNKHTMHIPMIILSAKTSEEERIQGLESGADIYISKPFSVQYLQVTVNRLLESRSVLREYYNSSASAFTFASGQLMKNEDKEFIAELTKLLDQNLKNSSLTPDDVAQLMCISSRTLYRRLQELNLESPKEFIRNYRVEVAARLLTTTSMTVQEIFYQTGFNTRTQFYNNFSRKYGVKPTDYRNQHRVKDQSLTP